MWFFLIRKYYYTKVWKISVICSHTGWWYTLIWKKNSSFIQYTYTSLHIWYIFENCTFSFWELLRYTSKAEKKDNFFTSSYVGRSWPWKLSNQSTKYLWKYKKFLTEYPYTTVNKYVVSLHKIYQISLSPRCL